MLNQTIWTGLKSTDWLDSNNWTKGVPATSRHAIIPQLSRDDRYPVITKNLKINFTLKNQGKLSIEAEVFVMPNGFIQNYGQVANTNVGTLVNQGNVINFGEWINEGTLENNKTFTNQHRCFNEGVIENHNTFVNIGDIVNTGVIDNFSGIDNNGSLENFNIISNHDQGNIKDESIDDILEVEKKMEAIFQKMEVRASISA